MSSPLSSAAENCAPQLHQHVKFGEAYVSSALNQRFFGLFTPGIYRGFHVSPAGPMKVLIDHGDDECSIAIVERDNYSISIIMHDSGYVDIPAKGEWFVCIEASYQPNQVGYQRIVVKERVEKHHVILAKVSVKDDEAVVSPIQPEAITTDERSASALATQEQVNRLLAVHADQSQNMADLAFRLLALELRNQSAATTLVAVTETTVTEAGSVISPIKIGMDPNDMGNSPIMLVVDSTPTEKIPNKL